MFPNTEIVGVEIKDEFVSIAKRRIQHYRFDNVDFLLSPDGNSIPDGLGDFDYIVLNAVYEHLLPNERTALLYKIWSHLKPGGILFVNQTPHRYLPLESHTTGLPLINFLPDKITLYIARRFSKRVQLSDSWETLLRKGIRGGTAKEIMKILNKTYRTPILMEPGRLGIKDRIDLWYKLSSTSKLSTVKFFMFFFIKIFKLITGKSLTPTLSLAIQKPFY